MSESSKQAEIAALEHSGSKRENRSALRALLAAQDLQPMTGVGFAGFEEDDALGFVVEGAESAEALPCR